MYTGDAESRRKATDATAAASGMICNILKFLNASPMTLFENPPEPGKKREEFYEETFEAFVSCMVSAHDSVRSLATQLAVQIFAEDGILAILRKSIVVDSKGFVSKFWRMTYVQHQDTTIDSGN
jgi:neurofibromin 1